MSTVTPQDNMKNTYLILFAAFLCSSTFGQTESKTRLIMPTEDFLNSNFRQNDTLDELTFSYLTTYYKMQGQRMPTHYSGFRYENWTCHWYQEFSEGIIYEYDSCLASGFVATITFTNVSRNDVVLLMETLYKLENNIWEDWKGEKTFYGPINQSKPRRSHEIQVKDGKIILRNCHACSP
jgi:hypothetical protein